MSTIFMLRVGLQVAASSSRSLIPQHRTANSVSQRFFVFVFYPFDRKTKPIAHRGRTVAAPAALEVLHVKLSVMGKQLRMALGLASEEPGQDGRTPLSPDDR